MKALALSLLELEALRQALAHWRGKIQRRYGWQAADGAYVRHGAIITNALIGERNAR